VPDEAPDQTPPASPEVEALAQQDEIREALSAVGAESPTPASPGPPPARTKIALGALVLLALGFAVARLVAPWLAGALAERVQHVLVRSIEGGLAVVLVLLAARVIDVAGVQRIRSPTTRYTIGRVLRLGTAILIGFIAISVVFENWYTVAVSLGLASLILGFALQTPITSFIGWIYILARTPFRVGDRIRIGEVTGDVIDIGYIDTTLWEFGGEYLSTDHPSGRLVRFPNVAVLDKAIFNYTWPLFPYIWNEVKLHVAYQTDLVFVESTIRRILTDEVGGDMTERVAAFRQLLARTPVDHLEVRAEPSVFFRISENTWIEVIGRYLVDPREAGRVKNRLIPKILAALNAEPGKVMFPKADLR
jgi:small-conductance mechanosensitive channel